MSKLSTLTLLLSAVFLVACASNDYADARKQQEERAEQQRKRASEADFDLQRSTY